MTELLLASLLIHDPATACEKIAESHIKISFCIRIGCNAYGFSQALENILGILLNLLKKILRIRELLEMAIAQSKLPI